jgi:hypothetical protein
VRVVIIDPRAELALVRARVREDLKLLKETFFCVYEGAWALSLTACTNILEPFDTFFTIKKI